MTLQEKQEYHAALAAAYQDGVDAQREATRLALGQAMMAVSSLIEHPNTCMNPGDKLSKAAFNRNTTVRRARNQIDNLAVACGVVVSDRGNVRDELDDDVPF
jgi:endonuclease I